MRSIEYENWKAIPTTTSFCFDDVTGCKTEVGGSEKFSIVFHQLLSHVAGHRRGWWTLKPPNRDDEPKNEIYSIYWIWNSTLYFWHIYYLCKSTKQKKNASLELKTKGRDQIDIYLCLPCRIWAQTLKDEMELWPKSVSSNDSIFCEEIFESINWQAVSRLMCTSLFRGPFISLSFAAHFPGCRILINY